MTENKSLATIDLLVADLKPLNESARKAVVLMLAKYLADPAGSASIRPAIDILMRPPLQPKNRHNLRLVQSAP